MAGTRIYRSGQNDLGELPSQQRKRSIFGRCHTVAAAALVGVLTLTSGTNIKNLGGNIAMAQTHPVAERTLTRKAEDAVKSYKEYMLTGNPAAKARVVEYLQDRSPQAVQAFTTEFLKQLRPDPTGPIIRSYVAIVGSLKVEDFLTLLEKVHEAVKAGRPAVLALKGTGTKDQELFEEVITPLVNLIGRADLLDVSAETRSSARTCATMFVSLIQTREKETRDQIAIDLWKRMKKDLDANGGVFPAGYMEEFYAVVKSTNPEMAAILMGYARDKKLSGLDKLTPADVKELFEDHLLQVMAQLWVGQADRGVLARVHGNGLTTAVNSYIVSVSTIKKAITVQELLTRIDEVEAFLKERGITLPTITGSVVGRVPTPEENLAGLLKSWRDKLTASPPPDQKALEILSYQIPNRAEVEEVEKVTTIRAGRIENMIEGNGSFYEVLGAKIFVPRLESYLAQVDYYVMDPRIGNFAGVFMRTHHVDRDAMKQLLDTVKSVNTAIPAAIETLDTDLLVFAAQDAAGTTGGEALRLERIAQFRQLLNSQIDLITDKMAAFKGIISHTPEWDELRKKVATRVMRQYVAVGSFVPGQIDPATDRVITQPKDPVELLVRQYEMIARDQGYLNFRATFTDALGVYMTDLTASPAATEGEKFMAASRISTAQQAIQMFSGLPLQSSYALYQALQATYGSLSSHYRNTEEMARVCSLIVGYSQLPPAYAALAYRETTAPLLKTYDEASILAITKAISGYSQMYIAGDHYRLMEEYYGTLAEKIAKLFPDITAMQADRRELTKDVRVRMPPEAEYGEVMIPGAQLTIHIPKRIYTTWAQKYGLTVSAAPRIIENPAAAADLFQAMGRYFGEPMVSARTNIPFPWMRLPILLNNLGVLAPETFPPVGEFIALHMGGDVTYKLNKVDTSAPEGDTTTRSDQGNIGVFAEATREGQVTTAKARYAITANTTTGPDGVTTGDRTHVGTLELQQLRLHTDAAGDYNVHGFSADITVIEEPPVVKAGEPPGTGLDSRVAAVGTLWSGAAPAGADTLIYFKRLQARDTVGPDGNVVPGDVSLVAHIFQRLPNGSFGEVDTVTIPKEQAEALYWKTMQKPMQRLYGAARVQTGDVLVQMDGAFLFSGPFSGQPESEWDQFQGAGVAAQKGEWGGYVDYEETRGRRGAAAFGRFRPEERSLWIGRFSMDMFKYGDEGAGNKYYAEGQYIKVDKMEVKAFVGFSDRKEDMPKKDLQGVVILNYVFGESVLGYRYGGLGGGRLIRRSGAPGSQFTDDMSGGRAYGIQDDLMGGIVVSGLYRRFTMQQGAPAQTPLGDLGIPSTNPALDEAIASQHPELGEAAPTDVPVAEQKLVAAGFRRLLSAQHGLELGALWDFTPNEGAAFVQYDWTPMGRTFTSMRLTAAIVYKKIGGDPLESGGEHIAIPLVGGATDWIANDKVRLKLEAFYPGIGEMKIFAPPVDTVFGGGYLDRIATGGHIGFRIPLTLDRRLILGILGSGSRDYDTGATIQATPTGELAETEGGTTQGEGAVGLFYTFPTSGTGLQLGNVYGWVTGMYQDDLLTRGRSYQLDAVGGAMFTDATTQVRGQLGFQHWQSWMPEVDTTQMRDALTTSLVISKRGFLGKYIDPFLKFDFSFGRRVRDVGPTRTEEMDIQGTFDLGATF
ncbi:Uncharacterised protein [Candidatus Bilamarchaeum dharawalense]|uniref:Uncharacterized protein n=1 Tax=Candidatus Bilamarchaeum dharawalense TaxID=2885759 RepID=A0A5E4LN50_9ARCH|nr:Uncharacterised protein [Candidatus Bilamarchaeum dharawalense]